MNFSRYEQALSKPRLGRYLTACSGREKNAMRLYWLNIRLSQSIFAMMAIFEVALRNSIDSHYNAKFSDVLWLSNSASLAGIFNNNAFKKGGFETKKRIDDTIRSLSASYSPDRLIASFSFGFWVELFNRLQYRAGGQGLHQIFINRPVGTNQLIIYKNLVRLRNFRNRIAHHEPICFNKQNNIDLSYMFNQYRLLLEMTKWMGYEPKTLYNSLDHVNGISFRISWLKFKSKVKCFQR